MKAELKFNKIKHFLDKRGFKYEEMHEKKIEQLHSLLVAIRIVHRLFVKKKRFLYQ